MLSLVLLMAVVDPDLVSLRAETARLAWSMCLDDQMEKLSRPAGAAAVPKEAIVGAAMERCYVFGQDVRRTLPDVAIGLLRGKGITSYSQAVVDNLADGTFKSVEEAMRTEKLDKLGSVLVPQP